MIKLLFKDESLIVDFGEDEEFSESDHHVFFVIASGYLFDKSKSCYVFNDELNVFEVLKETILYLEEKNIEHEQDKTVTVLLNTFEEDQRAFDKAKNSGSQLKTSREAKNIPSGLIRELKQYQQQGLEHLLGVQHGANFSVPGSGKTTVIYAGFDILKNQGIIEKLLVIGPRSCFRPWEEEFENCFGSVPKSCRLIGTKTNRQSLYFNSDNYDLFLCTFQTASIDIEDLIKLCKRYRIFVVIDESHNIKRIEGGVWSEAMLRIAPYAERRAILSGTPIPNDFLDLWTQITFLWPGQQVLGDRISYKYQCQDVNEVEIIRQAVNPFMFRTPKLKLGLPPANFKRIVCDMAPYQLKIYEALSSKYLREFDILPEERLQLRLWRKARMVRLIQAATNPSLLAQYSEEFDIPPLSGKGASILELIDKYPEFEIPGKIKYMKNLVDQIFKNKDKIIVWTTFVHNIRMLANMFEEYSPFLVYGAIPRDESEDIEFNREQQIREFKNTKNKALLIANPAACAESISLHRVCHNAIYLERTFNCGQYLQSLDRIHRIGLEPDEIVTYHILISGGTIDETIDRRLDEKEANMLHLLEDELPVGKFELEAHKMQDTEKEEEIDFEETIMDIRRKLTSNDSENR